LSGHSGQVKFDSTETPLPSMRIPDVLVAF
jgi:hypothetical protein